MSPSRANATPAPALDADQLPCGIELDALMEHIADGAALPDPAHHAGCPYCQAVLRDLRHGWEYLHALARQPVPVPPGLFARIMQRVRALAQRISDTVVLGGPRGDTHIGYAVLARVIGRLAATVPGVIFASANPWAHDPPHPQRLNVTIRLVVRYGPALDALANSIRHRLIRRVPALTGAQLDRIDITIDDLAFDQSDPAE